MLTYPMWFDYMHSNNWILQAKYSQQSSLHNHIFFLCSSGILSDTFLQFARRLIFTIASSESSGVTNTLEEAATILAKMPIFTKTTPFKLTREPQRRRPCVFLPISSQHWTFEISKYFQISLWIIDFNVNELIGTIKWFCHEDIYVLKLSSCSLYMPYFPMYILSYALRH